LSKSSPGARSGGRFLRRQLRRLRRLLTPALGRADALGANDQEAGLDLVYRFLLARPPDDAGRRYYLQLVRGEGMKLREVAAEIALSDEFQRRLRESLTGRLGEDLDDLRTEPAVDVRELAAALSVEELARTAEEYYRTTLNFTDRYLAKPFDDPHDVPDLLGSFAHLVGGLHLAPGMTVLDFGAGTCWTTRILAQLGCAMIATDVSSTALDLGKTLFDRLPPIGDTPAPRFLRFNGHRVDLPDSSVDRIICFDAFHHVPNPSEVMRELGRVLRPGGIAGFSEPGPNHSKAARSQYEMKNYVAFENDVVMKDIWAWARAAGFSGLELAIFSTESYRVSLTEFDDFLSGGAPLDAYGRQLRDFLAGHQTFFLRKGGTAAIDSRERGGLRGEIAIQLVAADLPKDSFIRGQATVQNTGRAFWLPSSTPAGGVNLGVHLRSRDGQPITVDFARIPLEGTTLPGHMQHVAFELAPPPPGEYLLEFDLVSERVGWFQMNGSATTTVAIRVGQGSRVENDE